MRCFFYIICMFSVQQLHGQTNWTKDIKTGCKVYNPDPQAEETVSWSGDCKDGLADGTGTLIWYASGKEVVRVIAPFSKGIPNGKGKYILASGGGDEGYFIDGQIVKLDEPYLNKIKKNYLSNTDSLDNYVGDGNAKSLFYYTITPKQKVKGVLVLICGTWETAEHNINSNKALIQQAIDSNLTVIIPSINQRLSLNSVVLSFFNTVFEVAIKQYHLPKDKFVIGGFSMGGIFSLRYAEMSIQDSSKTYIRPKAVYSVDGPTDLENQYYSFERRFNNPRNTNKQEAEYAINEFQKFMGGSPTEFRNQYIYYSTFSKSEKDGGNAKYLKLPVRIYNDLDVNWWIINKGNDLYDMNALDQSALINYLIGNGNNNAEFINAYGKGYRIEGNRHPHSWSIVEPSDCIKWLLKNLK